MLRSYILLAFRNIKRQPAYTILNVLGLTLGITATLFILLYLTEESRYDEFTRTQTAFTGYLHRSRSPTMPLNGLQHRAL